MYTYLWYFMIYSFLGWCCEVAFAAMVHGRFVNRGFLNGAVCPIYGFGVCIVYAFLMPFKDTWITLFALSMLLTSLLELVTGFVLDKLFHQRWWDYTQNRFNLGGYICLLASVGWGVGCLFVVKLLFPLTDTLISLIPHTLGIVILCVLYALFAADAVVTVCMMIGLNKYIKKLDEQAKALKVYSNKIGQKVSDGALEAKAKYEEITAEGTKVSELVDKSKAVKEEIIEKSDEVKSELAKLSMEFKEDISEKKQNFKSNMSEKKAAFEMREKKKNYDAMLGKVSKKYSRLFKAFPNFRFNDFPELTKALKNKLKGKKR